MDRKKRIVIGLPGNHFSNHFIMSWTRTLDALWKKNYEVVVLCRYASFVPFSRMQTLGVDVRRGPNQKPFNGDLDYDVWMTIDSDMVFKPEDVLTIIENVDIYPVVSGLYLMQDMRHYACITEWDVEYFKNNGSFRFITPEDVEKFKAECETKNIPPFMEVVYNGMGMFACRKGVIEELKYPYFDRGVQEITDSNGVVIMRDICSEDVAFCKNLKDAGYRIYVHCNVRVGHEKSYII